MIATHPVKMIHKCNDSLMHRAKHLKMKLGDHYQKLLERALGNKRMTFSAHVKFWV